MTPESARRKAEDARHGYWSELRKYNWHANGRTAGERLRILWKSRCQWDKALIDKAMADGEDII
jgi:hypothetical protein